MTRHDEDRARHRRRGGNVAQRTFESVEHAAEWTVQPWPRSAAMGDEVSWQSHIKILDFGFRQEKMRGRLNVWAIGTTLESDWARPRCPGRHTGCIQPSPSAHLRPVLPISPLRRS